MSCTEFIENKGTKRPKTVRMLVTTPTHIMRGQQTLQLQKCMVQYLEIESKTQKSSLIVFLVWSILCTHIKIIAWSVPRSSKHFYLVCIYPDIQFNQFANVFSHGTFQYTVRMVVLQCDTVEYWISLTCRMVPYFAYSYQSSYQVYTFCLSVSPYVQSLTSLA